MVKCAMITCNSQSKNSVIISNENIVEKISDSVKEGHSETLITCNSHLAKSFNILKNPFDRDSTGVYNKNVLTTVNNENVSKEMENGKITGSQGMSLDVERTDAHSTMGLSHRNINIHENKYFNEALDRNKLNDYLSTSINVPGTLNVKSCKHLKQCKCNQPAIPLNEALQSMSLAYNPITKQLHFSSSPNSSPERCIVKSVPSCVSHETASHDEEVIEEASLNSNDELIDRSLTLIGYSDGTHSSVSEQSDTGESLNLESMSENGKCADDLCLGGLQEKKVGISAFLSRAVSTLVGSGDDTPAANKGWLPRGLWNTTKAPQNGEQKYSYVVASSTALIQHIRPATLPAKDLAEESRHRAEYLQMLHDARERERREIEVRRNRQQGRAKREEAQARRVRQWQEVLPKFQQLKHLHHTRSLWWHGLPPCTRGRVWLLAIGNPLKLSHDQYFLYVQQARLIIAKKRALSIDPNSASHMNKDRIYELFSIAGKNKKLTSTISDKSDKLNGVMKSVSVANGKCQANNNVAALKEKKCNLSLCYLNLKQSCISGDQSDACSDACLDVIQLDIARTFPSLGVFQHGGPYYPILHALLAAYVTYKPEVGYVQGMSFLAAILVLNMDPADAFICFCNILDRPLHRAAFSLDQREMRAYFRAYEDLFKANLPALHHSFSELCLTPDLYCVDWLYSVFSRAMPLDVACRVWDLFARDGEAFLFRTAVGVLHLYNNTLLEMDFISAAQFLTRLPDTLSADKLFRSIRQVSMTVNKMSFTQLVDTYKGHV